ncbi:NblA/ycf18 family protein [Leptothoe sp. EHU-05/26/07-4]
MRPPESFDDSSFPSQSPEPEITLEQEFQLKLLEKQVKLLPPAQAQKSILESLRQMMVKDNAILCLMEHVKSQHELSQELAQQLLSVSAINQQLGFIIQMMSGEGDQKAKESQD